MRASEAVRKKWLDALQPANDAGIKVRVSQKSDAHDGRVAAG
jgi:hypothetical protein